MTFKIEQIPWNKGIKNFRGDYKLTEEHKRKIGKANKGKPNKFKGIPRSEETKRKISLHRKGFKFSLKAREKMSKSHIGIQANEKHPMWKGGISREPYGQEWTKTLKEAIRQRDQYKCRLCECPQEECIEKLNIHHIDYDKKNLNPTNLISLCRKCHSKTVSNREKWISLLSSRIKQVIIISFILLSFNLSNALAVVDIDLMEYPTNALAQAAYPSSEVDVVDQQQTTSDQGYYLGDYADNERRVAQGFQVSGNISVSAVEIGRRSNTLGTPTGNWYLRIETDNAGKPSGTLVNANATVTVTPPAAGAIVKGTFSIGIPLNVSTLYWLVPQCDNQATNNAWAISFSATDTYATFIPAFSTNGGASWTPSVEAEDMYFKIYKHVLQCYSEATIKTQGTYSLKGIATITDSLNDTFTRTVSPTIDLTGQTQIKFDIYSSRTGANIKIGIYDATVPTTTEKTYTVISANTWETVTWDISAVADANKDAISKIIETVVDATATNTFYIDNMYGEAVARRIIIIE